MLILPHVFREVQREYYNSFLLLGISEGGAEKIVHYRTGLSNYDISIAERKFLGSGRFAIPLITRAGDNAVRLLHAQHPAIDGIAVRPREVPIPETHTAEWLMYDFSRTSYPKPKPFVVEEAEGRIDDALFQQIQQIYAVPIGISRR